MAASWPKSIKAFRILQDFQDINYAEDINEIHDEIVALETGLGTNPYQNLPSSYTTLNAALSDLYFGKSPVQHNHVHKTLSGNATGSDHPQYALLTGANFTGPVTAPPAVKTTQLATLKQMQQQGLADENAVQNEINAQLANRCSGAAAVGSASVWGRTSTYGWTLIGGYTEGCTNNEGLISCSFGGAFPSMVQSFVPSKAATGLGSSPVNPAYFPCPVYDPSQVVEPTPVAVNNVGATVLFSYRVTGYEAENLHVAFTWMAIGR